MQTSPKRLIFYAITVAAIVLVYLKFSELKLIQGFFHQSNWIFLLWVVAIQVLSYMLQALNYRAVLMIKGLKVGVKELLPVSFVIQFISQAVPTAGISGQIFLIHYLKKYALTVAEGIGRAILELATLYTAYALFFLVSVVLLFRGDVFQREPRFIFFIYIFLALALICAVIFFLSQKRKRDSRIDWFLDRIGKFFKRSGFLAIPGIRALNNHGEHLAMIKAQFSETLSIENLRKHEGLFSLACFYQLVMLLAHVVTLYLIAISLGYKIPLAACFIAFTFSKLLSMISVVPGAPGVFEGAMTLILISFGVDKSVALAATLLTRAFTFWLPMPIGWILYGRYMREFDTNGNGNGNGNDKLTGL